LTSARLEAAARPSGLPSPLVLLWLISGCLMLQPLSTDLYLASLPHLARHFEATPAAVQQTLSLFVIGFGSAQLIIGPLSDRYGRRPVLLLGIGVYVAASVACALADSMGTLVATRFAQAVGCCSAVVIARAIVRDVYTPTEGAHIIAQASSLLALAPIFGPIAGGYLQAAFGWRAAFVVLTAFGAGLGLLAWRMLGETNRHRDPAATRPSRLAATYRGIVRSPEFWAYTLPGALSFASIFVFISGSSFALIDVLKVPTHYFGYCFAFGVTGYLAGTLVCRRLLSRIGIERTLSLGTTGSALAGLLFAVSVWLGFIHWAAVVGALFLTMFAHGLNFPCCQTGAVAPFPKAAGAAAGLLGFFTMAAALVVGTWVGAGHDGTLVPLSRAAAAVGLAVLAAATLLRRRRALPAA
jgi:DHA1 family bicyclomycin/chloramphenicol resistance-like MFS transporter